MTTSQHPAPNHHARYPGFAGPAGFLAAASMAAGGRGNARLAGRLSGLAAGDTVADIGCGPGTVPPTASTASQHSQAAQQPQSPLPNGHDAGHHVEVRHGQD